MRKFEAEVGRLPVTKGRAEVRKMSELLSSGI
jgi:hypothetical protein